MRKLLLVDGSNLLFQMFFGMPARIVNSRGKPIQGTLGFVGALLKIIRMVTPTHVLVIFDGEHDNPRSALDAEYKAGRTDYSTVPEEDSPFSQLPDVYAALDEMGICHFETTDCETDDMIAAYALGCDADMACVIASFDSDFFQLISDRVSVLRYRGKHTAILGPQDITEKFGIVPSQYADFKSLTGDPSDHICGADKVGPKTAAQLLQTFGSLDGILAGADTIAKPSVRTSIQQSRERLLLNRQLITLDGGAKCPCPTEQFTYHDDGRGTREILDCLGLL